MATTVMQVLKNARSLNVTFEHTYLTPPIVMATPFWKGSDRQVKFIPTVSEVSETGCTIVSKNAADNYFVNLLIIDQETNNLGGISASVGTTPKTGPEMELFFNLPFKSIDPIVLLTPFWKGQDRGVGFVETLDDVAASEAKVVSKNQAPNHYFVNHLAMDRGLNPAELEANSVNKTATGTTRVYFANDFGTPPIITLSAWWNDGNNGVGSVETVTKVTTQYFEVTSENAASNYFVNWVAIPADTIL